MIIVVVVVGGAADECGHGHGYEDDDDSGDSWHSCAHPYRHWPSIVSLGDVEPQQQPTALIVALVAELAESVVVVVVVVVELDSLRDDDGDIEGYVELVVAVAVAVVDEHGTSWVMESCRMVRYCWMMWWMMRVMMQRTVD